MSTLLENERAALELAARVLDPKGQFPRLTAPIRDRLAEDDTERDWAQFHALTAAMERNPRDHGSYTNVSVAAVWPSSAGPVPYVAVPLATLEGLVRLVRAWDGHDCQRDG